MSFDLPPPMDLPPAFVRPFQIEPTPARKGSRRGDRTRTTAPTIIGGLVILPDGTECRMMRINGTWFCVEQ